MKVRKTVSFILALLMLLPSVASCGKKQEKNVLTMGEVDIQATYSGQLSTSYAVSDKNGKEEGKNVIVIQLNSVSTVMIDNKYGSAQIIPVINEFKNNTLYYSDFFAQGSNVLNTEFSALNSLYAPLDGIINEKYLDNTFNSLPVILKEAGVKNTTAVAANDDRYAQRGDAYKAWGFDNVNLRDGEDDDIFNTALESIKNSDGNDFCFISTATSVYPYVTSLKGTLNVSTNGPLSAYLNAINATDAALGAFFEKLKAEGLYDNSLIVVYGTAPTFDEGYNSLEQAYKKIFPNGYSYEEAYRTPLMIKGASADLKGTSDAIASVYDVMPTVLDLYGAANKNMLLAGDNLLGTLPENRVVGLQSEFMRGTYFSDKVLFIRKSETSFTALDRETKEELRASDYKGSDSTILSLMNECDTILSDDTFAAIAKDGAVATLKAFYEGLPSKDEMLLIPDVFTLANAHLYPGTTLYTYHTAIYVPEQFQGSWYGLEYRNSSVVLSDGYSSGVFISNEFEIGEFKNLYTSFGCRANGGTMKLYVSVCNKNGVSSEWYQITEWKSDGTAESPVYSDDLAEVSRSVLSWKGETDGKARFKIKLEASAEGKTPYVDFLAFATTGKIMYDEDYEPEVEEKEFLIDTTDTIINDNTELKGLTAVLSLIADTTGIEKNAKDESVFVYDKTGNTYSNLAYLAAYAYQSNIMAFVDLYDTLALKVALVNDQQVIGYKSETDEFFIIYGFKTENKKVIFNVLEPGTGVKSEISATDLFENWDGEVLVMESNFHVIEITEAIIPEYSKVRPGKYVPDKKYIVIHNTGNYSPGSTALNHANYLMAQTNEVNRQASWHFTVDSTSVYQHIPTDENAWHASDGSGEGNTYGIAIEICVNGFPNTYSGEEYERWKKTFLKSCRNAAQLTAQLLIEYDLDLNAVKQHYDFASNKKNCPMQMRYTSSSDTFTRDNGDVWTYFINQVEKRYAKLKLTGEKFDTHSCEYAGD